VLVTTRTKDTAAGAESCDTAAVVGNTGQRRWSLGEQSAVIGPLLGAGAQGGGSIRSAAAAAGTPEATVRYWLKGLDTTGVDPAAAAFFLSPDGMPWLARFIDAAIFAFLLTPRGGIRGIVEFLERSGLSDFVASSYGAVQERVVQMQEEIGAFGEVEAERLASGMPHRDITVCEDENYHEAPCLVAIEPVSNYILCESYEKGTDGATWDRVLEEGIEGLNVTVVQQAADEGRGLGRHAANQGIHHSPDLFHPQQDITRATSGALARQVKNAQQALSMAIDRFCEVFSEAARYREGRRSSPRPGRYYTFRKELHEARFDVQTARTALTEARRRRSAVRQAARGISQDYHPFDLQTGATRDSDRVFADISARYDTISEIAQQAGLSEKAHDRIHKARALTPQMAATICWVLVGIDQRLSELLLPEDQEVAIKSCLIPGLYISACAGRTKDPKRAKEISKNAEKLLARAHRPDGPLGQLASDELEQVELVAAECAQLFQRSSSCTEGRNGVLSFLHHRAHHLGPRRLKAATVVHNFATRRPDGTTPAERLFGAPPTDLFEHLRNVMPEPKRPRRPRKPGC